MGRIVFYHWAKSKYLNDDSPNGDFVMDMVCDKEFPWYHCFTQSALDNYREIVLFHLEKKHACDDAISTFKELFDEYVGSMKHTYESRSEYYKKWRNKNKDKIAIYNRNYWIRKLEGEINE